MVKMKRGLLVCLLVLCSLGVREVVHADEVVTVLRASEVSISQGEGAYVDVSLEGSVDIAELSFAVFYNGMYLDVGYVEANLMSEDFLVDYETDGEIHVVYQGEEVLRSEGTLLRIFFNVEETAPTGLLSVTLERDIVKDSLGEDVHLIPLEGNITVEANEIVEKEVTFLSRVRIEEATPNQVVFEVYSEDYKGLTSFDGEVVYDSAFLDFVEASFLEAAVNASYKAIDPSEGSIHFMYAGKTALKDGEALLSVVLSIESLDVFSTEIAFHVDNLLDQDLRQVLSNETKKDVSFEDGVFSDDHVDFYVTSYGGTINQSFDLYVKIDQGSSLLEGDFVLTYDEEVLEVVRVQVGSLVTNKGGVLFFEDDVYDGDIRFSYFHEEGLEEEDTLLMVTFQAVRDVSVSSTSIGIDGLRVLSSDYSEIDYDYEDGFVEFYTAFLVKFLDYDGSLLSSKVYEENEEILAPDVTLRPHTAFAGWSEEFDLASKNQSITAEYTLLEEEIVFEDEQIIYDGEEHSLEIHGLPDGASVIYSDQDFVNVGLYQVSADVYLDGVYQFTKEATLEITPKALTLTVGSHERVYGSVGSIAYTVNGKIAGDDLDIEVFTLDGYDVGIHDLSAVVHNPNYQATIVEGTLEITKATYDLSGISFPSKTFTRGGNEYFLELEGDLPEGVSVTYINNGKTEIGSYTVTAEFYGDYDNYEEIPSMTAVLTIDPPTILGPTFVDQEEVYDGTNKTISVGNLPSGASVVYDVDNSYRNAGTYRIEATISKDGYDDMVLVATLVIHQAAYDMSEVEFLDQSFDFDGDFYELSIGGSLPNGVSVTYENNGHTEVGTYEVIAHFSSEDPNYLDIPSKEATLSIIDNAYADIVFEDKTVTYNGEDQVIELLNVPVGASVDYYPTNTFDDAGIYEVVARISMDGFDDYEMHATLTIEKEVLVIRAEDKVSIYGEDLEDLTYTVEGTIYNEEVMVYIDRSSSVDAGVYVIHVDASHPNYDISLESGTYTIEKATYDMSGVFFDPMRVVYNGDMYDLEITGSLPSGVDVEYLNNEQVGPGIYLVTAVFTGDSENYYQIPSMQARLIIEEAEILDVVFESKSVDYDGETHTLEVENVPLGASVLYTPSNSYMASGVYEVKATVSLEGHKDKVLYATLTINGQDIDTSLMGFTSEEYVYDDSLRTLILDGVLPEGVVGVEYANQRRIDAGRNLVLLNVFVEDGYNPVGQLSAFLDILPAEIEGISFEGGSYVYDGEAKSFVLSGNIAQYGHELTVTYSGDLSYVNAGEYTVEVSLSHPNYETLVIERTLTIEKAVREFDYDDFELLVYDHSMQIISEEFNDLIYYSVDRRGWVYGTTIPGLEEDTYYYIRVKLGETRNYRESSILFYNSKTYLSDETVEGMIEAIGEVDLSTREDILEILDKIDLLMPEEKEAQRILLDQKIEEYNNLIELYQYEYKLAGDTVENLFPLEVLIVNYQLVLPSDLKRRDLV